jgi:hypothetical protein
MPKKLHNIYRIAIFLLGVLPCVVSAPLWCIGLFESVNLIIFGPPAGDLHEDLKELSIEDIIFYIIMPWIGLIGTMLISQIFGCVLGNEKVPLKKIYQGLAISPLIIYSACLFPTYLTLLFIMFPILSLFVAMLYNRSWEKHRSVEA